MFVYLTSPKETFRYLSQGEATQLEADDWKCTYCFDSDTKKRLITHCKDPLQHSFHYDCMIIWLKEHNNCYVCSNAASYTQLLPWKERITNSSLIKNADYIQSIFLQSLNNIILRRLYIGGALITVSLLTNTPPLMTVGLFIPSTGFCLIKERSIEERKNLSTKLNEANKTIKRMEKARENSKNRIEELLEKKEKINKKRSPQEFKQLNKEILKQESRFELFTSSIYRYSDSARVSSEELWNIKVIYRATLTAQYVFFFFSIISLYYVFRQETSS